MAQDDAEDMLIPVVCPECEGYRFVLVGMLKDVLWVRCLDCGMPCFFKNASPVIHLDMVPSVKKKKA